jgi:hypothetical protein
MRFRASFITAGTVCALLGLVILYAACERDLGPAVAIQPTLTSIQNNIFTLKCATAGCHAPNGIGPMPLRNTTESFAYLVGAPAAGSGSACAATGILRVNPNDANTSLLYLKVNGTQNCGSRMPLSGQALAPQEITAIQQWINMGALNN